MSVPAEVDPVARAYVDSQLRNTLSDRLAIAEIPGFDAPQSDTNSGACRFVAQTIQPLGEGLLAVKAPVA